MRASETAETDRSRFPAHLRLPLRVYRRRKQERRAGISDGDEAEVSVCAGPYTGGRRT
jgi:hypothetical protein